MNGGVYFMPAKKRKVAKRKPARKVAKRKPAKKRKVAKKRK
jgi:hypothetical protein